MDTKTNLWKLSASIIGWVFIGAATYFFFGGLIWFTMTVGFIVLAYLIAEVCSYGSTNLYAYMLLILSLILLECGLAPTLLQEYCNVQWVAWFGAIGAIITGAAFLFHLSAFPLKKMWLGIIPLCVVLLWYCFPVVWEWYYWISIGMIALLFFVYFMALGEKIVFVIKNDLYLRGVRGIVVSFILYEVAACCIAGFLVEWSWNVAFIVLGIGIIGVMIGYIREYRQVSKIQINS